MELRDLIRQGRVELPAVGSVKQRGDGVPRFIVEIHGQHVEPIAAYLGELSLADGSPLTSKSYAYDLLRWWRLLTLLDMAWDDATRGRSGAVGGVDAISEQSATSADGTGRGRGGLGKSSNREASVACRVFTLDDQSPADGPVRVLRLPCALWARPGPQPGTRVTTPTGNDASKSDGACAGVSEGTIAPEDAETGTAIDSRCAVG